MPSSLMARLNAAQGSAPAPAKNGGGSSSSGRSNNVVTPPPPPAAAAAASSLGSSSRVGRINNDTTTTTTNSRPGSSSLASAAAGNFSKASAAMPSSSSSSSSAHVVPRFERNPMNATATASTTAAVASEAEPNKNDPSASTKNLSSESTTTNNEAAASSSSSSTAMPSGEATAPQNNKTLIQQLLRHPKEPNRHHQHAHAVIPPLPPSYYMCFESEAYDRQDHMELSPFECIPGSLKKDGGIISITTGNGINNGNGASNENKEWGTMMTTTTTTTTTPQRKAARHRPVHNPQFVVKKYRRSAAGGGALSEAADNCPRTLDQLDRTVDYLLGRIFAHQMPPPVSDYSDGEDDNNNNNNTNNNNTNDSGDANRNEDPNEISIWGEEGATPIKSRPKTWQQQREQEQEPFSLSETVAFVDDRLRAVQKDLVTLVGNLEEPNNNSNIMTSSDDDDDDATISVIAAKRRRLKHQRTKQTVRKMQAKMVRYNILASYLLSDVPSSKYEVKFGARALRTSLTCYLNLSTALREEYHHHHRPTTTTTTTTTSSNNDNDNGTKQRRYENERRTQDEIMAYTALLHSSAVSRAEESALPPPTAGEVASSLMEDSGSGWGAILSTFCRHVLNDDEEGIVSENNAPGSSDATTSIVAKYPRWKWALELACVAQEGNCQRYFSLLERGPPSVNNNPSTVAAAASNRSEEDEMTRVAAEDARFLILARCCASRSLNVMRLAQLRRYNHAFGKGEKVPAGDLARLLRFCNNEDDNGDDDGDDEEAAAAAKRAVDFCVDAGLPIVEKESKDFVLMKSAPIKVLGEEAIRRMCKPGRRMNDCFVFGSNFEDGNDDDDDDDGVELLADRLLQQCDIQENTEDWEDRSWGDHHNVAQLKDSMDVMQNGANIIGRKARDCEDGVLIPPSNVLRNLIE